MDVSKYDVGDNVTLSAVFTTSSVAADPTTITFKLKDPGGLVTTYIYGINAQLVRDSVGNYHVCYTILRHGTHHYRYEGVGALIAAEEDSFYVDESNFS